jgi:hypothetical protein
MFLCSDAEFLHSCYFLEIRSIFGTHKYRVHISIEDKLEPSCKLKLAAMFHGF